MKWEHAQSEKKGMRRGIYILPSLFTTAGLFSGFYAIIVSIQGKYEAASIAIIIAGVLDALDGRIARLTRTNSHFGIEYDSLSDLVAFGVAPAVLAFQWALRPFGRLGWVAASMYVICGALRLARFNVQKGVEDPNYFKGLPIPVAAFFVASGFLFTSSFGDFSRGIPLLAIILIYILSFLMVSRIRYYSFKKFDIRERKPFSVFVSIVLAGIFIAYKPRIMLFPIVLFYVVSGPGRTRYRARRPTPGTGMETHSGDGSGRDQKGGEKAQPR